MYIIYLFNYEIELRNELVFMVQYIFTRNGIYHGLIMWTEVNGEDSTHRGSLFYVGKYFHPDRLRCCTLANPIQMDGHSLLVFCTHMARLM